MKVPPRFDDSVGVGRIHCKVLSSLPRMRGTVIFCGGLTSAEIGGLHVMLAPVEPGDPTSELQSRLE